MRDDINCAYCNQFALMYTSSVIDMKYFNSVIYDQVSPAEINHEYAQDFIYNKLYTL